MVQFSGGKKLKLLTSVNLYSFERSRTFFLRRKQNYPITSHATTALCAFMLKGRVTFSRNESRS